MYLRNDKWANGDGFTYVAIYLCDGCENELPDCDYRAWLGTNTHLCLDCIKELFFQAYTAFDIPLLPESKGYLRYTLKARGKRKMLPKEIRERVFRRDSYTCKNCGCQDRKLLSVDHIKPYKLNGGDNLANLQTLCRSCNSRKSDRYET